MEEHIVKIIAVENVTHDVKRFLVERPKGYTFIPGQATEVSINTAVLKDEARPFTFTSLNEWPQLEFTIKIYDDHDGVTKALGNLKAGDELILRDVWGAITYRGPGWFIAGGAGITPFIAILRQLHIEKKLEGNHLLFSNKTSTDIILRNEFFKMMGDKFLNTLTQEDSPAYENRRIDKAYLSEKIQNFDQHFYVCGPDPFVKDIQDALFDLGAQSEAVVIER